MPDKPLALSQVFQTDPSDQPKTGVHMTVMFASGVVCFARGPIFPLPPGQDRAHLPSPTLQGSLLASYSDRTEEVAPQRGGAAPAVMVDSGLQRFSRQQADMLICRISAPVALVGPSYTAQIKFDTAATQSTKIDLLPNWNFLTGTTGTLRGGQATYSFAFFEYP